MTAAAEPVKIDGYHAHVYYDAETRPRASQLRETIAATLGVEVRELSDAPRGPHPVPQFYEGPVRKGGAVADAEPSGSRRARTPTDPQLL